MKDFGDVVLRPLNISPPGIGQCPHVVHPIQPPPVRHVIPTTPRAGQHPKPRRLEQRREASDAPRSNRFREWRELSTLLSYSRPVPLTIAQNLVPLAPWLPCDRVKKPCGAGNGEPFPLANAHLHRVQALMQHLSVCATVVVAIRCLSVETAVTLEPLDESTWQKSVLESYSLLCFVLISRRWA
ncbi:hypothetical protein DL95DRAFT_392675 [Leptodontidium sp. 2 PMI_412]|nr:hypothetical protein DL95DRAFT_392675 [Leptodontidium sp. 2 PMI_412]